MDEKCVGTVHTFQGKDANEVIFVLGCSDKSVGAMNWVVKRLIYLMWHVRGQNTE